MTAARQCEGPACSEPVHAYGLCAAHAKQLQRRRPLAPLRPRAEPPPRTDAEKQAERSLVLVAVAFADAAGEADAAALFEELKRAAVVFVRASRLDKSLDKSTES